MKETKTTTTIQITIEVVSTASKETQVEYITKDLNAYRDNLHLEVCGDTTLVVDTKPNSIVTRKYPANSTAELINNLGECYPYEMTRMLADNFTVVSIKAEDKVDKGE